MNVNYSIIIPHYNSFDSLNLLLKTIPENNFIEIIVIDDKSLNFMESKIMGKKNLKILKNTTSKKGAGVCRNLGISQAQGTWILFADSDDYFLPTLFESILKYKDDESDMVIFKTKSYYFGTNKEAKRNVKINALIENYKTQNSINSKEELLYRYEVPWGRLIKREFIQKNRLKFEEIMASNDVYFSFLVAQSCKKLKVDENYIYCVTDSPNSLTKDYSEEVINIRFETAIKLAKEYKKIEKTKYQPCMLIHLNRYRKFGIIKLLKAIIEVKKNNINIFAGINFTRIVRKLKESI